MGAKAFYIILSICLFCINRPAKIKIYLSVDGKWLQYKLINIYKFVLPVIVPSVIEIITIHMCKLKNLHWYEAAIKKIAELILTLDSYFND